MDYKTLFIFDVLSLIIYAIAISILALRNRRLTGLRWFAISVLLQLAQTAFQAMRGYWPTAATVLLPTLLNGFSFFAMYMGFQWTLVRKPLQTRRGPILFLATLAAYTGLYFFHASFDFAVGMAPVFVSAGLSVGLLLKLGTAPIRTVSRVTAAVLAAYMSLVIYQTVVMSEAYGYDAVQRELHDPRLLYSMLGLMIMSGLLVLMYLWFFVAERWSDLALVARLDPLTGVLNRRAIDEEARREISRAARGGDPLAMILIDIDYFKQVNDHFGHRGGDQALRALVSVLQEELRQIDLLGRLGGEEFVLFLPDTTAEKAAHVAERLRSAVDGVPVTFEDREIKLTVTAGVSQLMPDETGWEGMLARADEALYRGKNEGRNRVVRDERGSTLHIPPLGKARRFALSAKSIRKKMPDEMVG